MLGTGGGGLAFTERQFGHWFSGNEKKGSIYTIPSSTHGGLSSELSMRFSLHGLSHVISTGCTSSTDAIFYAAEHIALGRQERMLAGGVDSPIAPGILRGFEVMTVVTDKWNDEPHRASRPFSLDRSGIVIAEGSWIFVLEEYEAARRRGAEIYAEVAGYGATCDAYHRVRLEENGVEPARAMTLALADAGVRPGGWLCESPRHEHTAQRPYRDAGGKDRTRRPRIQRPDVRDQITDRPSAGPPVRPVSPALMTLKTGVVAPTINLGEPIPPATSTTHPTLHASMT